MPKITFNALVEDYSSQVLNTATRILGDAQKAQDVHQEVFLAIWRRWNTYNGQVNWRGYLYRTTVRKAIEIAIQEKNQMILKYKHQQFTNNDNAEPAAGVITAELREKLAGCLAKLPQRQADVFVLSRMEGFTSQTIAEILDCSNETVRVHLHRAVKRLAVELGDYLNK